MNYELRDRFQYRDIDFRVESRLGETNNFSIETAIFQGNQVLFSRKINYAYLLKKETNLESINQRLKVILKNQHNDIISNLKAGEYNNLIYFEEEQAEVTDLLPSELVAEESDRLVLPLKEEVLERINQVIHSLRRDLGEDLLLAHLRGTGGKSLTGFSADPDTLKTFNQIADRIKTSIQEVDYPKFGKHYILDIIDQYLVIIIPLERYQWGMMIRIKEGRLNELLNRQVPESINAFEKAILS